MRKKENPKYRKKKHVPLVAVPVPDDLITYFNHLKKNYSERAFPHHA
jgi:hypothetical protein